MMHRVNWWHIAGALLIYAIGAFICCFQFENLKLYVLGSSVQTIAVLIVIFELFFKDRK